MGIAMKGATKLQPRRQRSKLALAREREQQRTRFTSTRGAHSTVPIRSIPALESVQEGAATPLHTRVLSPKLRSNSSLDSFTHNAPKEYLLKSSPDELVQAILCLRIENKDLCKITIPPRSSSQPKEQPIDLDTPSRQQWTAQQEELLRSRAELGLAKEKVAELERELNREKTRVREVEEKANHLLHVEEELRQERAKVTEAEKQAKRTLKELAFVTRTEGNLYDDNHFLDEVKGLRYSIDNWVRNQSWRVVGEQSQSTNLKSYQFLKTTCRYYLDYIESPSELRTLVHSYIWHVLGSQVFGANVWAESGEYIDGPDGRNTSNPLSSWQAHIGTNYLNRLETIYLTKVLEETVDGAEENVLYHEWRVANARLIATRNSVAIIRAIEKETQRLVLDLDDDLKKIVEDDIDVRGLEELFHNAVKLDALMQRQRPNYMFYPFSGKGLEFDRNNMDATNNAIDPPPPESRRLVKLVVQPGFRKYGNSAGRNYDTGHSLLNTAVELF